MQLSSAIAVTEVSIEHIPVSLAPTGSIDSAPRDFTVWVSCSLPYLSLSLPLYPSLYFNSHFSRWTWLSEYQYVSILNFVGAEDDGSGSDNWSYRTCEAPVQQTK